MKKIMMFAAIAVAALSSCSNSEVVDMSAGNAIGFETYVGKATTKGTPVSGGTFADTSTMRVWGCTSADQLGTDYTAVTGLIPNLSSGTKVSKAGAYGAILLWHIGKPMWHTLSSLARLSSTIPASLITRGNLHI